MRLIFLLLLTLAPTVCSAETEGFGELCPSQICLWRRPIIDAPTGWERDEKFSRKNQNNSFFPTNPSFGESLMYASSFYRPNPNTQTLKEFIEEDRGKFIESANGTYSKVVEKPDLKTGDDKPLKVLSFETTYNNRQQFDLVAYGEEGDMFLIFTLSSPSLETYNSSLPSFKAFVGGYYEKPKNR